MNDQVAYCREGMELAMLRLLHELPAPDNATLAAEAGISVATVVRWKHRLRADGLVEYREWERASPRLTMKGLRLLGR